MVALRGRLMQQMASGAMLAVGLSEGEVEQWLLRQRDGERKLEVAAVNAGVQWWWRERQRRWNVLSKS